MGRWYSADVNSPSGFKIDFASWWRDLARDERPTQMRLFTAAIGALTLKDLHNHEILRGAISYAARFSEPFVPIPLLHEGRLVEPAVMFTQLVSTLAALLLIAQRHVRFAAGWLALFYGYVFVANRIDYTTNGYLHLLCLGLIFAANATNTPHSAAVVRTMGRALFSIVYLTAAIVKLEPNWLSGWLMEQAARHYHFIYSTKIAFYDPSLFRLIAIGTIGAEVFLALAPWSGRSWPYAAAMACAFHGLIEMMLPVRLFSYIMIASFLLSAPAERLAPLGCLRWLRRPIVAAGIGVTVVALLNTLTAQILQAYPLVDSRHERTVFAFALMVMIVSTTSEKTESSPSGVRSMLASPLLRRGALLVWLAVHIVLALKPRFGGSDEFAWRMFTEDLKLEVSMQARWDSLDWQTVDLYGANEIWSSRGYRHHWSSWGEQRDFVRAYGQWLLDNDPRLSAVKLWVRYQRNQAPWALDIIELTSKNAPAIEPSTHAE
ncbi:MAG: HTTM domain-containing protein [Polyangiaceae bacterium]